jgi:hypothetical protein
MTCFKHRSFKGCGCDELMIWTQEIMWIGIHIPIQANNTEITESLHEIY